MRDQTSNPTFTHTYTLQTLPRFFPVGAPGRLSAAANARLIASSRTPLADLPSARPESVHVDGAGSPHSAKEAAIIHGAMAEAPGRSDRLRESAPTTARNVSYSNAICGMSHPFRQLWV